MLKTPRFAPAATPEHAHGRLGAVTLGTGGDVKRDVLALAGRDPNDATECEVVRAIVSDRELGRAVAADADRDVAGWRAPLEENHVLRAMAHDIGIDEST